MRFEPRPSDGGGDKRFELIPGLLNNFWVVSAFTARSKQLAQPVISKKHFGATRL